MFEVQGNINQREIPGQLQILYCQSFLCIHHSHHGMVFTIYQQVISVKSRLVV